MKFAGQKRKVDGEAIELSTDSGVGRLLSVRREVPLGVLVGLALLLERLLKNPLSDADRKAATEMRAIVVSLLRERPEGWGGERAVRYEDAVVVASWEEIAAEVRQLGRGREGRCVERGLRRMRRLVELFEQVWSEGMSSGT